MCISNTSWYLAVWFCRVMFSMILSFLRRNGQRNVLGVVSEGSFLSAAVGFSRSGVLQAEVVAFYLLSTHLSSSFHSADASLYILATNSHSQTCTCDLTQWGGEQTGRHTRWGFSITYTSIHVDLLLPKFVCLANFHFSFHGGLLRSHQMLRYEIRIQRFSQLWKSGLFPLPSWSRMNFTHEWNRCETLRTAVSHESFQQVWLFCFSGPMAQPLHWRSERSVCVYVCV